MKMKIHLFVLVGLLGLLLPACNVENGNNNSSFSFLTESIAGNGEMIRKKLDVRDFESIILQGSMDVVLTQAGEFMVEAEGQENIIDLLNTRVDGGEWKIRFTRNVRNHEGLTIYISMPTLHRLQVSGSGDISCTNTFEGLGAFESAISGSGNIGLKLAAESVKARISGSGEMEFQGQAGSFDAKIMGSGDIDAFGLSTPTAEVSIAGSGNVSIGVTEQLKARIAGSGNIYYTGQPAIEQKVSGSGDVLRKG